MASTITAYEQVLRQGSNHVDLESGALRALFQLHYAEEEYEKSIFYIDKYQALQPALDPEVDLLKTEVTSLLSSL